MKKLFLVLLALVGFEMSSYAGNPFCSKCGNDMEWGEGHECENCDEYVCDDCWCDDCDMWCKPCHDGEDAWCPSCGLCMIAYGESCMGCDALICIECCFSCPNCSGIFCSTCVVDCDYCGEAFCENCLVDCGVCGNYTCPQCRQECNECGEFICPGCMCDECQYSCLQCHDDNGEWCPICGECMVVESNSSDTECWGCGTWYCKNCMCPVCELYCLECQESEGVNCKDCGSCAATDGGVLCTACDEAVCENCKMECAACGSPFCSDDMCGDCMEYCIECSVYCEDCGSCCGNGDDAYQCAECDRILCEDCVSECYECGSYYCNDCLNDACDAGCGICLECHESYEAFCEECGECLFVKERCNDHEYACAECHEEFICPDCGQCYAEDGELCESCGLCADCAMSNEMHCPECEACYEDVGRCFDDGEHCRECCENNEWICEFCDHCVEAYGYDRCSECGACEECVSSYSLHCANCNTCLYSDYPIDSDRPEYCESCMPTDEGIPCLVCARRLEVNECTYSGDGWHCDTHCVPCPFCTEVCFAEDPDAACSECGACSDCIDEHRLHCQSCGRCMYADYPDDNDRPEICEDCQAAEGAPCAVCGNYITENECAYGDEGWHCAEHCSQCQICNMCLAEATICPLCGRCSNCCYGHDDSGATNIDDDIDDEDLQEFLAEIEPIQDGIIYEGELGNSLDLTNYQGSDLSWISTYFPELKTFRCTSADQLNSLTDEQCATLEALYCPGLGLTSPNGSKDGTALDLSKYPNLKTLDCSNNNLTSLDLSNCPNLENLICGNNKFTTLDASSCANLQTLDCQITAYGRSQLTSLNIGGCTQLKDLKCSGNQLTALDLSDCAANLESLECSFNYITTLDLSGCTELETLNCRNNKFASLDVSGCTKLQTLICSTPDAYYWGYSYRNSTKLTSLNVDGCVNLQTIECNDNKITALQLEGLTNLTTLKCDENQLTSLDLSDCSNLTSLKCNENQLTSLNLSGLTALTSLNCYDNSQLSDALDLSSCSKLTELGCGSEEDGVTTLDLSNCPDLVSLYCLSSLTELDLSSCPKLAYLTLYYTELEELDLSNFPNIVDIEFTGEHLKKLDISNCPKLKRFYSEGNYVGTTIKANNSPALESFNIDYSETIEFADFSGCKNLKELLIYTESYDPFTLDLKGCGNLEYIEVNCHDVESLQLSQSKKMKYIYIRTDVMPCSFTFSKLFGCDDASVTNVKGATKKGDKYVVNANASQIQFSHNGYTNYCYFYGNIKHAKTSNHSYSRNSSGSYTHTYTCTGCGEQTETLNTATAEFLDVTDMTGDMSWVKNFTNLKGYRCNKKEHLRHEESNSSVLSANQMNQLTELYVSGNAYIPYISLPNLRTLDCSNLVAKTEYDCEDFWVNFEKMPKLENLYCNNNYHIWLQNIDQAVNLKNICMKGNANTEYLDLRNCTKLEHIETDAEGVYLRNCNNLRFVEATYGTVKFPYGAPIDTVILHKALPCTPSHAVIDDFTYFDPNIDMSNVSNVKGATYDSENQKWNVSSSSLTYYYNDNGNLTKHYIGFDRSHELGTNKKTYKITKAKIWEKDDIYASRDYDYGAYSCEYECGSCGKTIKESHKIAQWLNGIALDVTNWTQADWNANKEWIQNFRKAVTSVTYNAQTKFVMNLDNGQYYSLLQEIHIPNTTGEAMSDLGGKRLYSGVMRDLQFSDFGNLKVLECPWNFFRTLDLSKNRGLRYLDCRSCGVQEVLLYKNTSAYMSPEYDSHLRYIDCSDNDELATLDVSKQPYLETLICNDDVLTELNLSDCPKLEKLDISYTYIESIDVSNLPELRYLNTEQLLLEELDITNNPNLEYLNCRCDDGLLTELDLSDKTRLKYLDFSWNRDLGNVPVSHLTKLEYLDCSYTGLNTLDVRNMPNLKTLNCDGCNLTELDLSHNTNLVKLNCGNNQLTNLDLSNNPHLEILECGGNQLTELDLSDKNKLSALFCGDNQLTKLKLYNSGEKLMRIRCGNNHLTDLDISKCKGNNYPNAGFNFSNNHLLYFDASKIVLWNGQYASSFNNQTRHIDTLPCTFRFADLAAGMKDANVYNYEGIEPYTDGKTTMWHITSTDGTISYYYNNGCNWIPNIQHTVTFSEMSHKYAKAKRYFTDTIPATYDATGSCIMHTPCAYCSEEITETVVFDKLLCNVTVKDAREPGCAVEMGIGSEPASLSTLDGYNTKGNLVNLKLDKGTELQLKAVAATGYHFVRWSDGNTNLQRSFVVNSDTTLGVEFALSTYTMSVAAEHGTITGATDEIKLGSTVVLTATADEGYHFVKWSDGNTDNPRTVVVNAELIASANLSFTAIFEQNSENQGGENQGGENGGENNNPGTDVDETIAQAVKVYATGLTIHIENAVGDIMLFDANGRAISRTTAADGEPVEMQAPQMGVYIVRTAAGGVKVVCNNY